jgi:hypothetical protein
MKLTWFSGTTIRIHIGGIMLVADPDGAPAGIDRGELMSGAERTFALAAPDPALVTTDPAIWRPQRPRRAIDEAAPPPVLVHHIGPGAVLVDAFAEPPLVLVTGTEPPRLGRWGSDTVVVLFGAGEEPVAAAATLLDATPPRLIALAATETDLDRAIDRLRPLLDGTSLVSLEPGLALEV